MSSRQGAESRETAQLDLQVSRVLRRVPDQGSQRMGCLPHRLEPGLKLPESGAGHFKSSFKGPWVSAVLEIADDEHRGPRCHVSTQGVHMCRHCRLPDDMASEFERHKVGMDEPHALNV